MAEPITTSALLTALGGSLGASLLGDIKGTLGFGDQQLQRTERAGVKFLFNWDFLDGVRQVLGLPFSLAEMLTVGSLAQTPSLFGGDLLKSVQPLFSQNSQLPQSGLPKLLQGKQFPSGPTIDLSQVNLPTKPGGIPSELMDIIRKSTPSEEQETDKTFSVADILPAWNEDPDKVMDIRRVFERAQLDMERFTIDEFRDLVTNIKRLDKKLSGRSVKNFTDALGLLERQLSVGSFLGKSTPFGPNRFA